ncbi:unnamed protein product [Arabis nemorensis]|uniref:Uncharacterized protein n=1 Tax=Arabis nemorensis TaxID=586526 RepID=A0A565BB23_9BRAS|nr:unnamed protein product [Arabis nemorensis]
MGFRLIQFNLLLSLGRFNSRVLASGTENYKWGNETSRKRRVIGQVEGDNNGAK